MTDEEVEMAKTYRATIKWILGIAGGGLLALMAVVVFLWGMVETDVQAADKKADGASRRVDSLVTATKLDDYERKQFMWEMRQQMKVMAEKEGVEVVVDTTLPAPVLPDTTAPADTTRDST